MNCFRFVGRRDDSPQHIQDSDSNDSHNSDSDSNDSATESAKDDDVADDVENEPQEEAVTPQSLITDTEVEKALLADKGEDCHLISWDAVDFTKRGDNYACVVTSVEVIYSQNDEEYDVTYVAKLNPCRNIAEFLDFTHVIFMKEATFYLELVPHLNSVLEETGQEPLKLPKCFHANLNAGEEQIYFEDLRKKDFKMFDRRKGMDKDHASLVLRELARLHAASYLLQLKTPDEPIEAKHDFLTKDWLNMSDNSKEIMLPMLEDSVKNSVKMLQKVGGLERAISWIESLQGKLEYIFTTLMQSERYGSVCHGDCWNNNVLFRYNEEGTPVDVILLDLQMCRKASLATDLNYFLYSSLTGEVRGANLSDFMAVYHSSYGEILEAGGIDMFYTEDELLQEFREKNEMGALFAMMLLPVMLIEPEDVPDMAQAGNLEETMEAFRTKASDMIDTNEVMKTRFLAIFDEFIETGLIP